ncbi:MAG: hypothetical protein H8E66_11715 [Planctomycetes bacterium]|nr:hypothetical protein [Planctomycetota bacterium]
MFSDKDVARELNEHFEPVWQSVRPVPRVTIDFGNGQVIRRTLNGNVATYVCDVDGRVLDVLPGIYDPETYLAQVMELERLHRFVRADRNGLDAALTEYHERQAAALAQGAAPDRLVEIPYDRLSIVAVEEGVRVVLQPARRLLARAVAARPADINPSDRADHDPFVLDEDTRINEGPRRLKVHRHLAQNHHLVPSELTKWLYREVLNTDLDDPYLGLGKVLFKDYPF